MFSVEMVVRTGDLPLPPHHPLAGRIFHNLSIAEVGLALLINDNSVVPREEYNYPDLLARFLPSPEEYEQGVLLSPKQEMKLNEVDPSLASPILSIFKRFYNRNRVLFYATLQRVHLCQQAFRGILPQEIFRYSQMQIGEEYRLSYNQIFGVGTYIAKHPTFESVTNQADMYLQSLYESMALT
ncbi:hypothetical protein KC726_00180 [Candidatus Woesebacteria bacterium]|nr:hypothetical protein [Candidatus Woesebacteria bacterium]